MLLALYPSSMGRVLINWYMMYVYICKQLESVELDLDLLFGI